MNTKPITSRRLRDILSSTGTDAHYGEYSTDEVHRMALELTQARKIAQQIGKRIVDKALASAPPPSKRVARITSVRSFVSDLEDFTISVASLRQYRDGTMRLQRVAGLIQKAEQLCKHVCCDIDHLLFTRDGAPIRDRMPLWFAEHPGNEYQVSVLVLGENGATSLDATCGWSSKEHL